MNTNKKFIITIGVFGLLLILSLRIEPAAAQVRHTAWQTAVQQDILLREYFVTRTDQTGPADLQAGYQAPNRAQNLRSYFTESGVRIVPRLERMPAWEVGMRLSAYGREDLLKSPGVLLQHKAEGAHFSYSYAGLEEWYLNQPQGLEQGFMLPNRPAGSGWVAVEIQLSGSLAPRLCAAGMAVEFTSVNGRVVLRYDHLFAYDAAGREMPARMELSTRLAGGQRLRLLVDDTGARYPLIIDPVSSTPDWLVEGNQADALFGRQVDSAGDVNGDGYDDIIIAAPDYDNGENNEGVVFVYYGSPSGPNTTPDWTAESNQPYADLAEVSAAGDVNGDGYDDVILGVSSYDNGQTNEGAVFVYYGSASGLNGGVSGTPANAAWMAESNQAEALFGFMVDTAGDVNADGFADVLVGAIQYDNGQMDEGAVFVWHGSPTGLNGGSPGTPTNAAWMAESNQVGALMGRSVTTAGDVNSDGFGDVIVGTPNYDHGQTDEGAVFVWHGSTSGLNQGTAGVPANAAWTAESNQVSAGFGLTVGTVGNVNGDLYDDVIVGSWYYDNNEQYDEGAVFVWYGSVSGVNQDVDGTPENAGWMAEGNQIGFEFGSGFAGTAGDVNGDGFTEVLVGCFHCFNIQTFEGAVFVWYGSVAGVNQGVNGTPEDFDWWVESNQTEAYLGEEASSAGDVNGDGYDDVLVGLNRFRNGEMDEGAAYLYYGSPLGLNDPPQANADSGVGFITDEDTSFSMSDLLLNDFDPDGGLLSIVNYDDSSLQGLLTLTDALPGGLDPAFDADGTVVASIGYAGHGNATAVQPDGKIIVAVTFFNGSGYDFGLVRFNPDGSLDAAFDADGSAIADSGFDDHGWAVALQPDGKIIVAGFIFNHYYYTFALTRFNPDGSLDTAFGINGFAIAGMGQKGFAMAVQPDGKILVVGLTPNRIEGYDFGLARFNPDGSLDTAFDSDGLATADFSYTDMPYGVALQPDGKILVTGYASENIGSNFSLARFNPDGSLDTTFDADGWVITDFGGYNDVGYAVAVQPDGKILIAGDASGAFAVARFNPDGSPDTAFDSDGRSSVDFGSGRQMVLQADGKIVVSGSPKFSLVRFNPDGSLDTTYDGDGLVTAYFEDYALGSAIALQPDGKVIVVGDVGDVGDGFGVARFLPTACAICFDYNPDGQFDWLGAGETAYDVFTYTISDHMQTDTAPVTITVNGVNDAPILDPIGDKTVDELVTLTFTATATDVDLSNTLTFSLDASAPAGAVIDPISGVFTWTPDATGLYTIIVRVTDDSVPALEDFEQVTIGVGIVPVDLSIAMSRELSVNVITYTLPVANLGDFPADEALVEDDLNENFSSITWTCTGMGGAVCGNASGTGELSESIIEFPSGSQVIYVIVAQTAILYDSDMVNEISTVTVTAPDGYGDLDLSNNIAQESLLYRWLVFPIFNGVVASPEP